MKMENFDWFEEKIGFLRHFVGRFVKFEDFADFEGFGWYFELYGLDDVELFGFESHDPENSDLGSSACSALENSYFGLVSSDFGDCVPD